MQSRAISCAGSASNRSQIRMLPPPPKPDPEATLLAADAPAPKGGEVWVFEGTLERFLEVGEFPEDSPRKFRFRQRIAWRGTPSAERVDTLGRWIIERLSINGHLLVGLRARPETTPAEEARLVG